MKQGAFTGALRLIEDATDLLREMPVQSWLLYLAGVVPFFGLFLFEATDIYESPFAADRLPWISLLLALTYVWMHLCQAAFARQLSFVVSRQVQEPLSVWRLTSVQVILQSTKPLAWPVAALLVIPYSLVTMFYQHTLCLSGGVAGDLKGAVRDAMRDTSYRPGEAAWFLTLVLILRALIWINFLALFLVALFLFHSLTGVENTLTRQPAVLFNPTFLTLLCVLAYLSLDPPVKAACVLRSFRRRSEKSGLDLQIRLSSLKNAAAVLSLTISLFIVAPYRAYSATQTPPAAEASHLTSERRIEGTIREVFRDPNLAWSLPVVTKRAPPANAFQAFSESVASEIGELWDRFVKSFQGLVSRARKLFSGDQRDSDETARADRTNARDVWGLIALFTAILGAAVISALLRLRRQAPAMEVEARPTSTFTPNLAREDILADEQPDDEWLRLAIEYRRNGNLRLAIRAMYLSCLSSLATAKLISIARGKSNRDYFREFQRRASRLSPDLPDRLRQNVSLFERSWYGSHGVTDEMLDQFERNLDLLKIGTLAGAL